MEPTSDAASMSGLADPETGSTLVISNSFENLVDFFWSAGTGIRSILEDIGGAGNQPEYLKALRLLLVETLQKMGHAFPGSGASVAPGHELAFALQHGLPVFNIGSAELVRAVCLDRPDASAETLCAALLSFGNGLIEQLPGDVPDGMGTSSQRQILRAMRNWSAAAADTGADLGFLAKRFEAL
ncbi:hypothetical protein ASD44_16615 [Mesorhizobium sp. Root554]|uniref:DUF6031 family protein n=1 Tax=unclassified Mesorhizobium TaxID=325217 RepID=UPI0006F6424A|nr:MULTISPECIES: DUF6031 family protein [unclassified Mesorhizobium]KQZ15497.1 hypothetical protein ASD27_16620 [Mesorhizobium sp. Root1471]KQZ38006.1 hypothetical protein ASD44_16615 [Mesorhizobium sp. Root554]